jgi:hypothetical protein
MEQLKKFAIIYYIIIVYTTINTIFQPTLMARIVGTLFTLTFLVGTILFTAKKSIIGWYVLLVVFILQLLMSIIQFSIFSIISIIISSVLIFDLVKNGKRLVK